MTRCISRSISVICSILVVFSVCLPSQATAAESAERSLNDLTGPWQLFVDDYLVANTSNIKRVYHPFEKHPDNPIIKYDKPWEGTNIYLYGTVLANESGKGYRMWYHALPMQKDDDVYRLLYATSDDGIHWDKPNLGLVDYKGSKDNNIFIRRGKRDHIASIMHTPWDPDPQRRYKMINFDGANGGYVLGYSPDGINWTDHPGNPVFDQGGDVGQFFWDFHTNQYVAYVKNAANVSGLRRRAVARIATDDPTRWPDPELVLAPDTLDDRWVEGGVHRTHFYGMSTFCYESMYLGFLWVFRATDDEGYFDGPIHVELTTSRDGLHWFRQEGDRPAMIPVGPPDSWDDGMIFTATQPIVVGDELRVYYGGFDVTHSVPPPWHGAIGLATVRKDGFASLDAGDVIGEVTTKRLTPLAGPLQINYRTVGGWLRVEVLDEAGKVIPGFSRDDCKVLTGDSIDQAVTWGDKADLPATAARLRFVMQKASVYSLKAGDAIKALDEPDATPLAALYTFEEDGGRNATDKLTKDKNNKVHFHSDMRVDDKPENAAFGKHSMKLGSTYSPLGTIEIRGTSTLGRHFTLAMMAQSDDNVHARLFSSYDDIGPIKTTELVFDCDPRGKVVPALRLIVKGMIVESAPAEFADGKYHHLAVTYDDGQISFYLDSQPIGQGEVPGGAGIEMERNLFVGEDSDHGWNNQLKGHVDDVLVLGKVLTPDEVKTLTQKGAEHLLVK